MPTIAQMREIQKKVAKSAIDFGPAKGERDKINSGVPLVINPAPALNIPATNTDPTLIEPDVVLDEGPTPDSQLGVLMRRRRAQNMLRYGFMSTIRNTIGARGAVRATVPGSVRINPYNPTSGKARGQ